MSETHLNAYYTEAAEAHLAFKLAEARFNDAVKALEARGGSYNTEEPTEDVAEAEAETEEPTAKKGGRFR